MKIAFVASILGKDKYRANYERIVKTLEKMGHKVLADHVINNDQSDLDSWSEEKNIKFHKDVINRIKSADIVVSEISYSSLSVGYLLCLALTEYYKPTIVLISGQKEPNLLLTLADQNKVQIINYDSLDQIDRELPQEVNYAKDQMDVRFNFFVPPTIVAYLDWVAKKRKMPRAVYLRRLIEKDITTNEEYSGDK